MISLDGIDWNSTFTNTKNKSNEIINTIYQLKIILLGNSGVGKTSVLKRYMNEGFDENVKCTINAESHNKTIIIDSSNTAKIRIWDTCGQEKYKSLTKQYFKNTHGIILMYDVCIEESFNDLNTWLDIIKKNMNIDEVSIVLVGNKVDSKDRIISFEKASIFANSNDLTYIETSAKEGLNVETPFESVTKEIIRIIRKNAKFVKDINEKKSITSTDAIRGKSFSQDKKTQCC